MRRRAKGSQTSSDGEPHCEALWIDECQSDELVKLLSSAIIAGLLFAVAPLQVAIAAEAPKTKSDCEKAKDMKWDEKTKSCVKK